MFLTYDFRKIHAQSYINFLRNFSSDFEMYDALKTSIFVHIKDSDENSQ